MPTFGVSRSLVWTDAHVFTVCALLFFACSMSLLYREAWCMLQRIVALTLCLNFCEGRVKACIWSRSASRIVHHGG